MALFTILSAVRVLFGNFSANFSSINTVHQSVLIQCINDSVKVFYKPVKNSNLWENQFLEEQYIKEVIIYCNLEKKISQL